MPLKPVNWNAGGRISKDAIDRATAELKREHGIEAKPLPSEMTLVNATAILWRLWHRTPTSLYPDEADALVCMLRKVCGDFGRDAAERKRGKW